jgi:hypothetical protein
VRFWPQSRLKPVSVEEVSMYAVFIDEKRGGKERDR